MAVETFFNHAGINSRICQSDIEVRKQSGMSDVLICAVKREAVKAVLTGRLWKILGVFGFTSPEFAFIGEKSTA